MSILKRDPYKSISTTIVTSLFTGALMAMGTIAPHAYAMSVDDALKLCNAGVSSEVSASVSADVANILKGTGALTAEAKKKIEGIFLNGDKVNPENAQQIYTVYITCLEKFAPSN
ncbi:hypothetical protein NKH36_18470 [Mesorhizobium sp. M1312]|uniref:hypothetical protein n=1 Tax=unclassified Mesorhizobium TaxID=325217 RepID=UPI003334C240